MLGAGTLQTTLFFCEVDFCKVLPIVSVSRWLESKRRGEMIYSFQVPCFISWCYFSNSHSSCQQSPGLFLVGGELIGSLWGTIIIQADSTLLRSLNLYFLGLVLSAPEVSALVEVHLLLEVGVSASSSSLLNSENSNLYLLFPQPWGR